MINYVEKGSGLHERLSKMGLMLREENGNKWVSSNDAVVQAVIDAYSGADAIAPVVAKIKERARQIILAKIPEWKQANMTARATDFIDIRSTRELTSDEQAEFNAIRDAWAWVKSIRSASDAHEATLSELADAEDFTAISSYDINSGWPEEA